MTLPQNITIETLKQAIKEMKSIVGEEWIYTEDTDISLYRDAYSPYWGEKEELVPSSAVAPNNVEEVQAIVRIANKYRIPIYPISTGKNLGYGGSAPNYSGSIIVDLKRMNRIIEVNDRRNFCIVEPGVSYFDLYNHIETKGLKVVVDVPDPGWGSPLGNALEHGVGYMMGQYRDHFNSHCGMEVVLPNGELMRTGVGAAPKSETFAEHKYGFGPYVNGLFSQGNLGIVTKMGFWMFPRPECFLSGRVIVQRYEDLIPLIDICNYLEDSLLIGQVRYESPLQLNLSSHDPELIKLHQLHGGESVSAYQNYSDKKKIGFWTAILNFYGPQKTVETNWKFAKERLKVISGTRFERIEKFKFPLSESDKKEHCTKSH